MVDFGGEIGLKSIEDEEELNNDLKSKVNKFNLVNLGYTLVITGLTISINSLVGFEHYAALGCGLGVYFYAVKDDGDKIT